jgi:divalent metal cation (Fe/Co/Zn/Cd) transporter
VSVISPQLGPDHRKARAARFSIASNTALIVLKVVAGVITGSVAIITEAVHSAVDLVASVVAYFSVRKAEEPADRSHPYGHEKVENLAAALEGVLITVPALPGANTMPCRQIAKRPSSLMLLAKYFAMCDAKRFTGSKP